MNSNFVAGYHRLLCQGIVSAILYIGNIATLDRDISGPLLYVVDHPFINVVSGFVAGVLISPNWFLLRAKDVRGGWGGWGGGLCTFFQWDKIVLLL